MMSDTVTRSRYPEPKMSPWGAVQHASPISEHLWVVGTAGHGGIKVPKALNEVIDAAWRNDNGWYEEDCEWAIVAVTFPTLFPASSVTQATTSARNWFPDEYYTATGIRVAVEDSHVLQERQFHAAAAGKLIVTSAFGDWHETVPEGMVGVIAQVDGNKRAGSEPERKFLVPEAEYKARGPFGFVVDPEKYAAWPPHHQD